MAERSSGDRSEDFQHQLKGEANHTEKKPWNFPFRKKLLYLLVAAGAAGVASHPRDSEDLLLGTPGVQEMYKHESFDADEKEMAADIKTQLGEVVGNFAIANIETGKSVASPEIRIGILGGQDPKQTPVKGFSEAGASDVFIEDVLRTLPKGIQLQIKGVEYDPSFLSREEDEITARLEYGSRALTLVAVTNPNTQKITFLKMPRTQDGNIESSRIAGFLLHEQAHSVDWNSNSLLMRKEKMSLLMAILHRLDAPDRFESKQFTTIESSGKLHRYMQAMEYFAEISRVYLDSPSPDHEPASLSPSDSSIVQSFMDDMSQNGTFDNDWEAAVRDGIIAEADGDQEGVGIVERWKNELKTQH